MENKTHLNHDVSSFVYIKIISFICKSELSMSVPMVRERSVCL